jgi:hypothetical protein
VTDLDQRHSDLVADENPLSDFSTENKHVVDLAAKAEKVQNPFRLSGRRVADKDVVARFCRFYAGSGWPLVSGPSQMMTMPSR